MDFDNTNRVSLWKNDYKESDRHPDYKGNINVNGKDYDIALWVNDSDNERAPKFKGKVQEPYKKDEQDKKEGGFPF